MSNVYVFVLAAVGAAREMQVTTPFMVRMTGMLARRAALLAARGEEGVEPLVSLIVALGKATNTSAPHDIALGLVDRFFEESSPVTRSERLQAYVARNEELYVFMAEELGMPLQRVKEETISSFAVFEHGFYSRKEDVIAQLKHAFDWIKLPDDLVPVEAFAPELVTWVERKSLSVLSDCLSREASRARFRDLLSRF